jgi:hypothetical protein
MANRLAELEAENARLRAMLSSGSDDPDEDDDGEGEATEADGAEDDDDDDGDEYAKPVKKAAVPYVHMSSVVFFDGLREALQPVVKAAVSECVTSDLPAIIEKAIGNGSVTRQQFAELLDRVGGVEDSQDTIAKAIWPVIDIAKAAGASADANARTEAASTDTTITAGVDVLQKSVQGAVGDTASGAERLEACNLVGDGLRLMQKGVVGNVPDPTDIANGLVTGTAVREFIASVKSGIETERKGRAAA